MKKILLLVFIAAIIACSSYRSQPFPYWIGIVHIKFNNDPVFGTGQIPRIIRAGDQKEAEEIYNTYIYKVAKERNGVLLMDADHYKVWKVDPDAILKKSTPVNTADTSWMR